jgi:4-diphosphocytidyl-2-C-methyl-D-erythritol kinase
VDTSDFSLPSFAKINWYLRVLGKRPDGYHEIRTILQTITLHDRIHFTSSDESEIVLTCDNPAIPTDETNLIVRAAERLRELSGTNRGARISLTKRIPVGAGLGGGSSNAAVALLGLNRLWQTNVSIADLAVIAAELGADVPFFLVGGSVGAEGIGTTLTKLPDQPKRHLIVVTPNVEVSTAEAYKALSSSALTTSKGETILAVSRTESFFHDSYLWDPVHGTANDFERVIFDIEPEIKRAREVLEKVGARGVLLAGSGSSVFGIFNDQKAQEQAYQMIEVEEGWQVFRCATMSRNEYASELSCN